MKRSIVLCYFIALEFVNDARKSLLKEYRLDAPRMSAGRLFQILLQLHYGSWWIVY